MSSAGNSRIYTESWDPVVNTWNLLVISWNTTVGQKTHGWLNGSFKYNDNAYPYDTSENTLTVGSQFANGTMGAIGVWDIAFRQLGIGELGFSPEERAVRSGMPMWRVRNQNLIDYWAMWGNESPEPNMRAARTLTLTGVAKGTTEPPTSFLMKSNYFEFSSGPTIAVGTKSPLPLYTQG